MNIVLTALGLATIIELVTIYLRMVLHRKSDKIQKKLRMPRVHHSYPGFALVLADYAFVQHSWLFVIGFALILSDVLHHLVFEPYIKKHGYDIGMKHHAKAHHYVKKIPVAAAFVGAGMLFWWGM